MPIFHQCVQGSPEWLRLRMGRPTASSFDRIITPGGKPSAAVEGYINELLAERVAQKVFQGPTLEIMQRGHDLESEAVAYYELMRGLKTEPVGFVTTDDGRYGASPDRLVSGGLLEIKCPLPGTHIGYMRTGGPDKSYYPQLQGQLLVTGAAWVDIVSYHPDFPEVLVRVERDDEFIALLSQELDKFCLKLGAAEKLLRDRGYIVDPPPVEESADWLNISDEEIQAMFDRSVTA